MLLIDKYYNNIRLFVFFKRKEICRLESSVKENQGEIALHKISKGTKSELKESTSWLFSALALGSASRAMEAAVASLSLCLTMASTASHSDIVVSYLRLSVRSCSFLSSLVDPNLTTINTQNSRK